VHLTAPVFEALAGGDLAGANAVSPVPLSPWLADPVNAGVWKRRLGQVRTDPAEAAWVTGVIVATSAAFSGAAASGAAASGFAVGRAGFHSAPDAAGLVEIGYAVDPQFRRQGYAREALRALIERAEREPAVRTVRLSIRPDNAPSLAVAAPFGFRHVGEQWDEEDGREILWERDVHQGTCPATV
jgi:RimJ/RimL family protein N-acetyltransferase